jgi:hypothetical protein
MKNFVFALLAAFFSSSSFAGAMDMGGRRLPAANSTAPAAIAGPVRPMAKTATGVFSMVGDSLHPASRVLSLYITPSAQWYASAILQAAAQWSAACGVKFEQVNAEPPASARSERTVVVVEFGPSAVDGTSAKTFREASADGQNLVHAQVVLTNIHGDADSYFVVLHELGHALGLPHASDPAAVMNGNDGDHLYYVATGTRARLTSTDIDGCKQLMASAKLIQANREILAHRTS